MRTNMIGTHNAKNTVLLIKNLSKFIGSTKVLKRPTI